MVRKSKWLFPFYSWKDGVTKMKRVHVIFFYQIWIMMMNVCFTCIRFNIAIDFWPMATKNLMLPQPKSNSGLKGGLNKKKKWRGILLGHTKTHHHILKPKVRNQYLHYYILFFKTRRSVLEPVNSDEQFYYSLSETQLKSE